MSEVQMKITCSVSLGELVDKISILMIKEELIKDESAQELIGKELLMLKSTLSELKLEGIETNLRELKEINQKLWVIEDEIREEERASRFGKRFIELARAVYKTNDQRFLSKKKVNDRFGSNFEEVKSYKKY